MLKSIFKLFIKCLLLLIVLTIIGTGSIFYYYSKDLPNYDELVNYDPKSVSRVYSADGKLIEEYASEYRIFVPIKNIPTSLKQSFISAEDSNFYHHSGVDVLAILRAIVHNTLNVFAKRKFHGGSTITQQVIKHFLLSSERSLSRKVKEAILAYRISQVYSKDKILELYLNQVYLGNGAYGVAAASKRYFNKSLEELTIEDSAMLAGLAKGPSVYNPKKHYSRAIQRRDYVLNRMFEDDYITQEALEKALGTKIVLQKPPKRIKRFSADYFADQVRNQVINMYGKDALYNDGLTIITTLNSEYQKFAQDAFCFGVRKYDKNHGFRGPITNIASIAANLVNSNDKKLTNTKVNNAKEFLPKHWEEIFKNYFAPSKLLEYKIAMVIGILEDSLEVAVKGDEKSINSGYIKAKDLFWAINSGKKNKLSDKEVISRVPLKIGDIIAVRTKDEKSHEYYLEQIPEVQGGFIAMEPATGKVVAMVGGYDYQESKFNRAVQASRQPGSAIKPFVYLTALERGIEPNTIFEDKPIALFQGPNLPMWTPKNYIDGQFLGDMTMRTAFEKSTNTVTVQIAQLVGLSDISETIQKFKINANPPEFYSLVLGALETTLQNLTTAYATIANGCKEVKPQLIEMIKDKHGKIIYQRDSSICYGCNVNENEIENAPVPIITSSTNGKQIASTASCYQLTSLMAGSVERGTSRRAKVLKKTIAAKTGTSNNCMDAWMLGFTPNLVVGTYIGYDMNKSMGKYSSGGVVALPVFVKFMEKALENKESLDFIIPPGIELVNIDPNTGMLKPESEFFEALKVSNPLKGVSDTEFFSPQINNVEDIINSGQVY